MSNIKAAILFTILSFNIKPVYGSYQTIGPAQTYILYISNHKKFFKLSKTLKQNILID